MVSIRKAKQGFALRRRTQSQSDKEKIGLVVAGLCIGFLLVVLYNFVFIAENGPRGIPESLRKTRKHPALMETVNDAQNPVTTGGSANTPKVPRKSRPLPESFNAIALDITETLDCSKLLDEASKSLKSGYRDARGFDDVAAGDMGDTVRRRLQGNVEAQHGDDGGFEKLGESEKADPNFADDVPEEKWGEQAGGADQGGAWNGGIDETPRFDDFGGGGGFGFTELSAKHLFCLAASENAPKEVVEEIKCDATMTKRKTMLELWSAARPQMQDTSLFLNVLDLAREHKNQQVLGRYFNIWAPNGDEGMSYMLSTLNSDKDVDHGGLHGLDESLGPGKLFVDVGSCLGLTCLAVTHKYPNTKIVSIEPASPNWLMQQLNLRCNLEKDDLKKIKVVLAGVGPNTEDEESLMAKFMWRPTSTTSVRAWTPAGEHKDGDIELVVRLRRLKSIMAEADAYDESIDVMNLDCQGCEYNLIPALTSEEFDAIPSVMAKIHWGYIPYSNKPSSARGKTTHERLCTHENVAKTTKECCDFPDLPVKSSVPGEILLKEDKGFPPRQSTVSDVILEGLCSEFDVWAEEQFLHGIQEDWGWVELTSEA
ncbi:FkbM family methyltransferase [Nitzschia inconspicua]|uniref:FkbM family methyltransferase n=1 Tax=Nitzschia inconspicua TaxID=303405 RepID=A0A9K3LRZ9_9STRA|nr:FkbM family methyltransferase [Nitzschia inconspicua]